MQEMGFEQGFPEFVAYTKLLERMKLKKMNHNFIEVIDLFSPSESPKKTADDNIAKEDMKTIDEYREVHKRTIPSRSH